MTYRYVVASISTACAIFALDIECFGFFQCIGYSMLPTLYSHDQVVVDRISYNIFGREFKLGDVVVASSPQRPDLYVSKRILGMPGDVIIKDPLNPRREFIKIPPGHCWLAGDNQRDSTDSRTYGPVPLGLLRGRVIFRLYPEPCWIRNGFDETDILLRKLAASE